MHFNAFGPHLTASAIGLPLLTFVIAAPAKSRRELSREIAMIAGGTRRSPRALD